MNNRHEQLHDKTNIDFVDLARITYQEVTPELGLHQHYLVIHVL